MDFGYRSEGYYMKMMELQEKLRKSEEERFKLEERMNELIRNSRDAEQERLRILRHKYHKFLEEDKKREERNEMLIRILERIENRSKELTAKSERIKELRKQYKHYFKRHYPQNYSPSFTKSTYPQNKPTPLNYQQFSNPPQAEPENLKINSRKILFEEPHVTAESKLELLEKYLRDNYPRADILKENGFFSSHNLPDTPQNGVVSAQNNYETDSQDVSEYNYFDGGQQNIPDYSSKKNKLLGANIEQELERLRSKTPVKQLEKQSSKEIDDYRDLVSRSEEKFGLKSSPIRSPKVDAQKVDFDLKPPEISGRKPLELNPENEDSGTENPVIKKYKEVSKKLQEEEIEIKSIPDSPVRDLNLEETNTSKSGDTTDRTEPPLDFSLTSSSPKQETIKEEVTEDNQESNPNLIQSQNVSEPIDYTTKNISESFDPNIPEDSPANYPQEDLQNYPQETSNYNYQDNQEAYETNYSQQDNVDYPQNYDNNQDYAASDMNIKQSYPLEDSNLVENQNYSTQQDTQNYLQETNLNYTPQEINPDQNYPQTETSEINYTQNNQNYPQTEDTDINYPQTELSDVNYVQDQQHYPQTESSEGNYTQDNQNYPQTEPTDVNYVQDNQNYPQTEPKEGTYAQDNQNYPQTEPTDGNYAQDNQNYPQTEPAEGNYVEDPQNYPQTEPAEGNYGEDPQNYHQTEPTVVNYPQESIEQQQNYDPQQYQQDQNYPVEQPQDYPSDSQNPGFIEGQQGYIEDQQVYSEQQQGFTEGQQDYTEDQGYPDGQQYTEGQQKYPEGYDQNYPQDQYPQEYEGQQYAGGDAYDPSIYRSGQEYLEGEQNIDLQYQNEQIPAENYQEYQQDYQPQEYQSNQDEIQKDSSENSAVNNMQPIVEKTMPNLAEMLDTDSESVKQNTKVSNDSDFDFSK